MSTVYTLTTADGATLDLDWLSQSTEQPGSAVLYRITGGGMTRPRKSKNLGRVYDLAVRDYVATSGVPMLVVDYRVAPEYPHPAPVEDCYAALRWLADNADELGIDPARIAVDGRQRGRRAGGGRRACWPATAAARPSPSSCLIYPMLDDRTARPTPQLRRS